MNAIEVNDLWQSYRARRLAHARTLKAAIATLGRKRTIQRWALRGVDFEVPAGEMLGVIGSNGSGKSTLLRSLAGIYRPVKGSVTVRGRSASLIDLTAGFQRDLSARDNIFLSGAIYGVPRRLLEERFDEILDFAELQDEADSPLRVFSTGMAMRLGFSLAVSLEPDLLLVDEVLAVGDESFKTRCLTKVNSMRDKGSTIVFVSHELSLVRSLCDRALVLAEGKITFDGPSSEAIERYCEAVGVDVDTALSRTSVEPSTIERVERSWTRKL
jgi:ABC-type polysaccharide/polyol phosphate transport system ATPase subunit